MLTITLSKNEPEVRGPGYQDPIPDHEVEEFEDREEGDRPR